MLTLTEILKSIMDGFGRGMNAFILASFKGIKFYQIPLLVIITLFSLISWCALISFTFFLVYKFLKKLFF